MERNDKLTPLSQTLRKNTTKEENLLWYRFLRKYPLRFRRQYVIGDYIVDFFCHGAKLVVELDGSQHYEAQGMAYDAARTAYLQELGFLVLRFPNSEVNGNLSGVCELIDHTVGQRLTLIHHR